MAVVAGFISNAEGRAALRAAINEALRRNARLVVVVHAPRGDDDQREAAIVEATELTNGADIAVELRATSGEDLAEELLQISTEVEADLIVIGLRRRSITGKLILGSNAQRILLDSATPVLAIKSNR